MELMRQKRFALVIASLLASLLLMSGCAYLSSIAQGNADESQSAATSGEVAQEKLMAAKETERVAKEKLMAAKEAEQVAAKKLMAAKQADEVAAKKLMAAKQAEEVAQTKLAASQPAEKKEPQLTKVTTVEGITEYNLDNGLRVLLFPDEGAEKTFVIITYFVGSRHEEYGETGIAHMVEHMVFKGTPNHPNISKELTDRGASPNGTTWLDRTNYFEEFAATDENLEWALDLEADRMVNSFISAEDWDSERIVIRSEWESGENQIGRVLSQRLRSAAFDWHNYGNSTIGSYSDIVNVPVERLKAFYKKYYQPDNAQLMIAGKFDEQRALELVKEKFGSIPRPDRTDSNQIFKTYTAESPQDGERIVTLERIGDVQLFRLAYHIPAGTHRDAPAIDVLAFVLGTGPSSRLYKSMIETQIATSAWAGADSFAEPGLFTFGASVPMDGSLEEAQTTVESTIANVLENPPTQEEVDRAKLAFLNSIEQSFNNPIGIARSMSEWGAMGDWRLLFLYRDNLEKVTPEDVHAVAQKYFKNSNRTIAYFKPLEETPERVAIEAAPPASELVAGYKGREAVEAGEDFAYTPDNVASRTQFGRFANGARYAMLSKQNRGDTVTVRINMRYGTEELLMNKGYAASMASGMPMRGSAKYTKQQISDEITRLKLSGGVSAGLNSASVTMNTVRENLPAAIAFLGDIAKNPVWDPDEFELIRKQTITNLESSLSEPSYKASYALQSHLNQYPKGHPNYVSSIEEDIEGYTNVTLEEAKAFYEEFVGLGPGTTIVIVGDFDPAVIPGLLEEEFGDWTSSVPYKRIYREAQSHPALREAIETPDKQNAFFLAGIDFPFTDTHPDFAAMRVASFIMGGGFLNSRLATRIRQNEGLSYGISAGFSTHPIDDRGLFSGYAISAPENSEKVQFSFLDEMELAVSKGFTHEEVEAAKSGMLDSQKRARASDNWIANVLSSNLFFERDMEFVKEQDAKLAAITAEEVSTAFAKHVDPNRLSIVRAGDFAKAKLETQQAASTVEATEVEEAMTDDAGGE